jgi:hypothetical protein
MEAIVPLVFRFFQIGWYVFVPLHVVDDLAEGEAPAELAV